MSSAKSDNFSLSFLLLSIAQFAAKYFVKTITVLWSSLQTFLNRLIRWCTFDAHFNYCSFELLILWNKQKKIFQMNLKIVQMDIKIVEMNKKNSSNGSIKIVQMDKKKFKWT